MSHSQNAMGPGARGGIFHFFTDRKINTKISIGFACVLAITAVISTIAYFSLMRIATSLGQYSQLAAVASTARDIDRGFLALRRFAREFSLTGDEEMATNAQKARNALRDKVAHGFKIIVNPERRAKLTQVSELFEAYGKNLDKAVSLRREQDRLQKDVLDPTGAKLRTDIEQLQNWAVSKAGNTNTMILAGEALKQLMLARLNVNKMLTRHDQVSATAAEKAFADLKLTMTAFGAGIVNDDVRRLFAEVNTSVEKYDAAYRKASHDAHEVEVLVNGEMRNEAQAIATGAESITESAVAAEHAIEQETDSLVTNVERIVLMLALGGLAFGALLAWLIGRAIANPIKGMTGTMTALASGDLKVEVPALGTKDEIGEMAKAVLVFREAAIEKVRADRAAEEERVRNEEARRKAEEEAIGRERAMVSTSIGAGMAKLAAKDLTFRLTDDLPEAYRKLQSDFNSAMEQLEKALQSVRSSTLAMDSGTQEISTASNDLSRRTEQQASSLEETAAALDQITATVKKAAEGATHARTVVAGTKTDAEKSGEVVRKAVEAMGGIEKSSQKISQIIGVIDEIAFQTNLLALNAGVEAARAGDAGRGFAVVASEVRALAQRSAEAAKEIKGLISTSTAQVEQGVELVAETGKSLERIVAKVAEINGVVTDIAAGAQEQATGLQQVNTAVNQMDKVTQQNAAMAEQATAASRSLSQESSELTNVVSLFKVGDDGSAPQQRRAVAKSEAVRSPARSSEPAKSETPPARRQLKTPAGRNGSAALRKPEAAADEEGWQDF
jgi:methyl-accepting chemotaxis protein